MKRVLFIALLLVNAITFADCINCPKGTTAPGAAASPTTRFNGYTSEVNKYDGTAQNCYSPTANTLNGHLKGINNALCDLQELIDSLSTVIDDNDSTALAGLDSLQVQVDSITIRLDSIVTALGQFYNTSVISSDSSLNVSSSVTGDVITFNLSVDNDSIEIDSGNGLSGNGRNATPVKLGGTLTENTTISGNVSFTGIVNAFTINQTDSTNTNTLFSVNQFKKYTTLADFGEFYFGASLSKKSIIGTGTFDLSSGNARLFGNEVNHKLKLVSGSVIKKTGDTSAISFGDVCNLDVIFDAAETNGGNITSMRNLTLYPIYKGANVSPFTVYRYVSLALTDLNLGGIWATPTDRYAIYQEGQTDKVWLESAIIVAPNLPVYADDAAAVADTTFPSGGLYKTTGSVAVKCKP
jgi:hypothetical protein